MKFISLLLTLCLTLQFCFASALAGTLYMEHAPYGGVTSIRTKAAVPKIGVLFDPYLVVVLNDSSIEVQHVEPGLPRRTILSGVLFGPRLVTDGAQNSRFNAYCYFDSGEKLSELLGDDANVAELVVDKDGRRMAGKITSVSQNRLTINMNGVEQRISTRHIATVVSCRVYKLSGLVFPIPSTESNGKNIFQAKVARFELDPTLDEFMTIAGKRRLESKITSASYTKTQKMMLIGVAFLATAAAIALPVALAAPLAGRQKRQNNQNDQNGQGGQKQQDQAQTDADQNTPIR